MHPSKTVIFSMVVLGISLINAEKTVAIVPNVSIVPVVPTHCARYRRTTRSTLQTVGSGRA